jgi:hypothetical protein
MNSINRPLLFFFSFLFFFQKIRTLATYRPHSLGNQGAKLTTIYERPPGPRRGHSSTNHTPLSVGIGSFPRRRLAHEQGQRPDLFRTNRALHQINQYIFDDSAGAAYL